MASLRTPEDFGMAFSALLGAAGLGVDQVLRQRPVVSRSTLYDWKKGDHLPEDSGPLLAIVQLCLEQATRRKAPLRAAPGDAEGWLELLAEAKQSRDSRVARRTQTVASEEPRPSPAQAAEPARSYGGLPNRVADLVGRDQEIEDLLRTLGPRAGGPPVALVAGMAGVGKSALVTNAAYLALERGWFPGGVIYLDLSGYDSDGPVSGDQAVRTALRELGVSEGAFEPTAKGRQAQYRARLAERGEATLIVLDNAASDGQVVPLVPGAGPHRVVVTSRLTLDNPRHAARIDVEVLSVGASIRVLGLADQDPAHAERLADLCGRLPLALQIVAASVRVDPRRPLPDLVAELADEHRRLDALEYHDSQERGVRAALTMSYTKLTSPHQRLLRLLSLNPRHQPGQQARRTGVSYLSLPAAAALAGEPPAEVRRSLVALTRAHLLEYVVWECSTDLEYWRLHDLVLLYVRELAAGDGATDALNRYFDHYIHNELVKDHTAMVITDDHAELGRIEWREQLGDFVVLGDQGDASYAEQGFVWNEEQQGWAHSTPSPLAVASRAVREAQRSGDRHALGLAKAAYGAAWLQVGEADAADQVLRQAAELLEQAGDRHAHDRVLVDLALALACGEQIEQARDVLNRVCPDDVQVLCDRVEALLSDAEGDHARGVLWMGFGQLLRMKGRPKAAINPLNKAVAQFRRSGFRRGEGFALANLGWALRECSFFGEGERRLREAAEILVADGVTVNLCKSGREY
ncbi:ATP-binding protein [Acrocarpospora sp. B8E8]|uniref:ATP-binding protein n=1 Tax=Acrocarpospora sp. B8E8 TaxID=3153572 RepID=UPI00325C9997